MSKALKKIKFFNGLGLIPALALFSTSALSNTSYLDPTRIDYQRPDSLTRLELIDCYTTGNCNQDDKIRIYPMPCAGSNGADCTGCYEMRGGAPSRVADLNSVGTCAGVGSPGMQKLRVFVGYERSCPGNPAPGTPCSDGQLLLSCQVSSEGAAGTGEVFLNYNRDCFSGRPYVRRARAGVLIATALPSLIPVPPAVCEVGTIGTYPNCIPCSDTSYKTSTGSGACTECAAPVIANSLSPTYSTAGTTKSSVNDCRVVDFTCMGGYTRNFPNLSCDPPAPPPSPTPSPSPVPSPSPIPTTAPGSVTCPDVGLSITFLNISPTTIIGGVDQKTGKIDALVTWNPVLTPEDSVLILVDQYVSGSPPKNRTVVNLTSSGSIMHDDHHEVGDFYYSAQYTIYGQYCPRTVPVKATVLAN